MSSSDFYDESEYNFFEEKARAAYNNSNISDSFRYNNNYYYNYSYDDDDSSSWPRYPQYGQQQTPPMAVENETLAEINDFCGGIMNKEFVQIWEVFLHTYSTGTLRTKHIT